MKFYYNRDELFNIVIEDDNNGLLIGINIYEPIHTIIWISEDYFNRPVFREIQDKSITNIIKNYISGLEDFIGKDIIYGEMLRHVKYLPGTDLYYTYLSGIVAKESCNEVGQMFLKRCQLFNNIIKSYENLLQ